MGIISDRDHSQAGELVHPAVKGILRGPIESGWIERTAIAVAVARSGQVDEANPVKAQKGNPGTHQGEEPAGGGPVHVLADATGELRAG
jgi:hypothetical protein